MEKHKRHNPKALEAPKVPLDLSFVVRFEDKDSFQEAQAALGSTVVAFARFLRWVRGKYR